ncbi:MAG: GIY-YIG nuclease family protein [Bacteroidetes bacterium]|nr:GIY-YIG nuclease family protein [Bacteroidota bacterium]
MKTYFVYMLANQKNGTLYVGVTNNLQKRIQEHKNEIFDGFTKKYHIHSLVWFDTTSDIESAILKEKQLKNWQREWKIELIEKENPEWKDLSGGWS